MKYLKYFKGVLHNDGLPQLNAKEWARMMNIASIEHGLTQLEKVKEMNQNGPEPYKYDLMILKERELVSKLTKDLPPNDLIREMIIDSND